MTTRTDTIAHAIIAIAGLATLAAGVFAARPAPSSLPEVTLEKVTVTAQRAVAQLPKVTVTGSRTTLLAQSQSAAAPTRRS